MKKHTLESLEADGYKIRNAKITNVFLGFDEHDCFTLYLMLEGNGWGIAYGGYCLGNGCLSPSNDFAANASAKGMESVMRILKVVGVSHLCDLKGQYVRTAEKGYEGIIKIIGNILEDKWFDYGTFFDSESTQVENKGPCHRYVSSSCVDGSCSVARAMAEGSIPLRNLACEKCQKKKNKGCDDCALNGTPVCMKSIESEEKRSDET